MPDNDTGQDQSDALNAIPIKKSPDFRTIYSNVFQYRINISDCSIIFSTMSDSGSEPQTFEQTRQIEVIMALGQLKNLSEYLSMIVLRYEREIGPIDSVGNIPPNEKELDPRFEILKAIGVHR
jgi:hypothetical protein